MVDQDAAATVEIDDSSNVRLDCLFCESYVLYRLHGQSKTIDDQESDLFCFVLFDSLLFFRQFTVETKKRSMVFLLSMKNMMKELKWGVGAS